MAVHWKTKQAMRHLVGKCSLTFMSSGLIATGVYISEEVLAPPIELGTRYFHKESTSGIDTYEDWLTDNVHEDLKTETTSLIVPSGINIKTEYFSFVSEALSAGTLKAGAWTFWVHAKKSLIYGDGDCWGLITCIVYLRRNGAETELFRTDEASVPYTQTSGSLTGDCPRTEILDGDRIVIKVRHRLTVVAGTKETKGEQYFYCDTATKNSRVIT